MQLEELFSSSFSLQAEDMAGHFGKAPATSGLQGQNEASALPSSRQAPFDWSLKTRVRFVSSEPFALAEEAACCSASAGTPRTMADTRSIWKQVTAQLKAQ